MLRRTLVGIATGGVFLACGALTGVDDLTTVAPADDAAIEGSMTTSDGASTDASSDGGIDIGSPDASPDAMDASVDAPAGDSGIVHATFEESPGANTYANGLAANNWVASGTFVNAHSGATWFGSANGSDGTFSNLGLTKNLGGVVENRPYEISFYVVQYEAGYFAITLADFSKLRIGGPNGVVTWTSTPTPTEVDAWVKWTGTYTPAPADVGGPFFFEAVFNLDEQHTIGIDGPISAIP